MAMSVKSKRKLTIGDVVEVKGFLNSKAEIYRMQGEKAIVYPLNRKLQRKALNIPGEFQKRLISIQNIVY